nr:retrotransposon protein, putative, Ty1-copia subclass [Tanacetum cinerariifolium]
GLEKLQASTTAMSAKEAEYIDALEAAMEAVWIRKFISGLGFREATFILIIKIYRDRSKRLIGLGQNAYMDKIIKRYKMDNSKHGHIPMQERLDLNKTQGASTPKEVKRMQNLPYASVMGSIIGLEKLQASTTAMSAKEAEYIDALEAAMEAVWIRKFISGL